MLRELSAQFDCPFFEVSAKLGHNILPAFLYRSRDHISITASLVWSVRSRNPSRDSSSCWWISQKKKKYSIRWFLLFWLREIRLYLDLLYYEEDIQWSILDKWEAIMDRCDVQMSVAWISEICSFQWWNTVAWITDHLCYAKAMLWRNINDRLSMPLCSTVERDRLSMPLSDYPTTCSIQRSMITSNV